MIVLPCIRPRILNGRFILLFFITHIGADCYYCKRTKQVRLVAAYSYKNGRPIEYDNEQVPGVRPNSIKTGDLNKMNYFCSWTIERTVSRENVTFAKGFNYKSRVLYQNIPVVHIQYLFPSVRPWISVLRLASSRRN